MKLTSIDIFSDSWIKRYGQAISNNTLEEAEDFSQISDFWCLNPDIIQGGLGRVIAITGDSITLRPKMGNDLKFSLGACSRMEVTIASMPEIGQQLFWRGVDNGQG